MSSGRLIPLADAPGIPRWAPDRGVGFGGAIARFWLKYGDFSGRASLREYWFGWLFLAGGYVVSLGLLYGFLIPYSTAPRGSFPPIFGIGVLLTVCWFAATVVPWLALEARRLHDANLSGYLLFIHLASWIGALVLLVMCQLGANPLGRRFDAPTGEPPRHGAVGNWPPAPGEPDMPYPVAAAPPPPPSP